MCQHVSCPPALCAAICGVKDEGHDPLGAASKGSIEKGHQKRGRQEGVCVFVCVWVWWGVVVACVCVCVCVCLCVCMGIVNCLSVCVFELQPTVKAKKHE